MQADFRLTAQVQFAPPRNSEEYRCCIGNSVDSVQQSIWYRLYKEPRATVFRLLTWMHRASGWLSIYGLSESCELEKECEKLTEDARALLELREDVDSHQSPEMQALSMRTLALVSAVKAGNFDLATELATKLELQLNANNSVNIRTHQNYA